MLLKTTSLLVGAVAMALTFAAGASARTSTGEEGSAGQGVSVIVVAQAWWDAAIDAAIAEQQRGAGQHAPAKAESRVRPQSRQTVSHQR